jgi:hypothetical protein
MFSPNELAKKWAILNQNSAIYAQENNHDTGRKEHRHFSLQWPKKIVEIAQKWSKSPKNSRNRPKNGRNRQKIVEIAKNGPKSPNTGRSRRNFPNIDPWFPESKCGGGNGQPGLPDFGHFFIPNKKFGVHTWDGKFWCISWPFGIFIGILVNLMANWYFCGHFGMSFPFWFIAPGKMWQPCCQRVCQKKIPENWKLFGECGSAT